MAIHLRNKSFAKNLLLSIGGIFILFVICINLYQYSREKAYKTDNMHARLQMYNYEMAQDLGEDSILNAYAFTKYVQRHHYQGLRVTIIDLKGNVLLDSQKANTDSMANHLQRREVQQAIAMDNGYDIKRTSKSTHETYFYSATRIGDIIIRSAVPYSSTLTESLKPNYTYLYFTILLTILFGMALYYNTTRIGRHIGYLRQFAKQAEEGMELDHKLEQRLPDDELGDISHTIIALFWKLRHAEEDKLRIKRQLTQNAAHELKTPVASIHGYLESILENPDMPAEKRQHFLERCHAQSKRMSKLLLDMAALTKLDEKKIENTESQTVEKQKQVDVAILIHNALDDTALELQSHHITPSVQIPKKIIVSGDPSLIYSIIRNLIDNTIAYATGANKLKIVCVEIEDNEIPFYEFTFSDNGVGVTPPHLSHLFERFYRVDAGRSRKLGGTGLGLAIVKNAVAAHRGTVSAEITPGGGLTIRFTLARF